MYLWDSDILRHFGEGHPTLRLRLARTPWPEIALPSIVVAEVLRGRCEFALKAPSVKAPIAHRRLFETMRLLNRFNVLVFDNVSAQTLSDMRRQHRSRKRYADMLIAAMGRSGGHTVVTRNQKDFVDLLPKSQVANWTDREPG